MVGKREWMYLLAPLTNPKVEKGENEGRNNPSGCDGVEQLEQEEEPGAVSVE